jgi:hypothetical protein
MNYGELKEALIEYSKRTDITSALADTFLKLAEQRIYFGEMTIPCLRISAMREKVSLATSAKPADFLEAIKIAPDGKPSEPIYYKPMAEMPSSYNAYSWDGDELVLSTDKAFPVELTYYKRFTTPALDTDTNWLLTNAPNVYLSAMMVEVARWSMDDAMAAKEAANYASSINALISQDSKAQHSGSRLIMRARAA